jgi:broad specificity phosphatase PhoE
MPMDLQQPKDLASPRRSARLATSGSLWVVRHGERADVADQDWWETAERPHDPPLTERGLRQATAAGRALSGQPIRYIYSSPFRRCVQTACQIAEALGGGLCVKIEPGLGELLNEDWFDFPEPNARSGCPVDAGMSTDALVAIFGADRIDATHEPLFDVSERGEPCSRSDLFSWPEQWHEGMARYLSTLRTLQEVAPYSVLVTHGAGVQACAESVEGIDMNATETEINYCCLTQLHRQGGSAWKCAVLAAHKHIAAVA